VHKQNIDIAKEGSKVTHNPKPKGGQKKMNDTQELLEMLWSAIPEHFDYFMKTGRFGLCEACDDRSCRAFENHITETFEAYMEPERAIRTIKIAAANVRVMY